MLTTKSMKDEKRSDLEKIPDSNYCGNKVKLMAKSSSTGIMELLFQPDTFPVAYSGPSVFTGDWLQDTTETRKSADTQLS